LGERRRVPLPSREKGPTRYKVRGEKVLSRRNSSLQEEEVPEVPPLPPAKEKSSRGEREEPHIRRDLIFQVRGKTGSPALFSLRIRREPKKKGEERGVVSSPFSFL